MPTMLPIAIFCLASPAIVYFIMGLGRIETVGPFPRDVLPGMLFSNLRVKYGISVLLVVGSGIGLTPARFNFVLELAVGLAVGWAVGSLMAKYRVKKGRYEQGGPDMSVPDEKLFPSDRAARLRHEGISIPLPLWMDVSLLVFCEAIGAAAGFAWISLTAA